jgi:ISXO2-like transposase domain
LHHSKLPQATWFWAAYLMATHSNGISALALQRPLALGSYKSGWLICAKLRHSMVAPNRNPLAGLVEVNETEIACRSKYGPVTGGVERSHQRKIIVVGAVEDGGPGRICLAEVPDYSADSLHPFITGYLTPRATAKTEGWSAYPLLPASLTIRMHRQDRRTCRPTWVHRIFSNLKVWALDVYHGLRRSPSAILPRRVCVPR